MTDERDVRVQRRAVDASTEPSKHALSFFQIPVRHEDIRRQGDVAVTEYGDIKAPGAPVFFSSILTSDSQQMNTNSLLV